MWRLCLFGRFEAKHFGAPVPGFDARRVQELMSVLLLSADRSANREILADRLWPDTDTVRSKKYLRQTLWQLQRCFEQSRTRPVDLVAEPEWVRLVPGDDLWVDVLEFQKACDVITRVNGGVLSPQDHACLVDAVDLYRGELLEGWYHDWCREPREAFRSAYLTMLGCLMEHAELTRDWRAGLRYGRLALQEDRAYERAHLHMMRFHCLAGNRAAALRQFDTCTEALREELAVEPDTQIRDFVEQVRCGGTAAMASTALVPVGQLTEEIPANTPVEVVHRLNSMTRLIDAISNEIVGFHSALESLWGQGL
jgi:DNA-binding SARP family transcriptional activator